MVVPLAVRRESDWHFVRRRRRRARRGELVLFLWVGTVGDSPSLWPFHVYIDSKSANEVACDLSDYNTYIAIAIALVVVYFGLREGGSSKGERHRGDGTTCGASKRAKPRVARRATSDRFTYNKNERRNEKDCNFTRYSLSKRLDEM